MTKPPASVSFIGTFGLTLSAIVGLFLGDTFLAKLDKNENNLQAVRLFEEGRALLNASKNDQAIDRLTDAIEIDRTNRKYSRTLARAQMAAGDDSSAKATLKKLLESDSADGQSSLLMAEILCREQRYSDAVAYFHRAIYSHWSEDETANRQRARNELINLLAQQNSKQELLAELLALEQQAPADLGARVRMGNLFLQAGSPTRAMDVFRAILHADPRNVQALEGVGAAEFARANYRSAQKDFEAALHQDAHNTEIQKRLDLSNQVLELDPTLRGLGTDARFQRSTKVLALTTNELTGCINQNGSPKTDSPETQALLSRANELLASKTVDASQSEASEANLDLAEQLWQLKRKTCKPASDNDSPLALVLARQTQ